MDQFIKIKVKTDFSKCPGLRTYDISRDKSGEYFYHTILNNKFYQAVSQGLKLIVDLDGTAGYPPSFIDEAFGRLIYDFGEDMVREHLDIISNEEPIWKDTIYGNTTTMWQKRRNENRAPQITSDFSRSAWWHRGSNNTINLINHYDLE